MDARSAVDGLGERAGFRGVEQPSHAVCDCLSVSSVEVEVEVDVAVSTADAGHGWGWNFAGVAVALWDSAVLGRVFCNGYLVHCVTFAVEV